MDYKYFTILFLIFSSLFFYILRIDNSIGDGHGVHFGKNFFVALPDMDGEFLTLGIPNMLTYFTNQILGFNFTGGEVLRTSNYIWGAIGLLFLLKISRKFFPKYGILFLLLFIINGYTEMFFGYWEDYTQPLTLTIILIYYCMKSIHNPKHKLTASIMLAFCIASHSTLITLYGGFFPFLVLDPNVLGLKNKIKEVAAYTLIIFGIYISLYIWFYINGMPFQLINTYSGHYSKLNVLFSSGRYIGILQELFAVSGMAFLGIIAFFIVKGKKLFRDRIICFFLGSLLCYLAFMIIYIHPFHYSGDWPLMSVGGVLLTLFFAWIMQNYCSDSQKSTILPIVVLTNLLFYVAIFFYGRTYI